MANKEKPKFDKDAYDKQYHKDYLSKISVYLHRDHDIDIIEFLKEKKSKSDYIKKLIRKDMDQ